MGWRGTIFIILTQNALSHNRTIDNASQTSYNTESFYHHKEEAAPWKLQLSIPWSSPQNLTISWIFLFDFWEFFKIHSWEKMLIFSIVFIFWHPLTSDTMSLPFPIFCCQFVATKRLFHLPMSGLIRADTVDQTLSLERGKNAGNCTLGFPCLYDQFRIGQPGIIP